MNTFERKYEISILLLEIMKDLSFMLPIFVMFLGRKFPSKSHMQFSILRRRLFFLVLWQRLLCSLFFVGQKKRSCSTKKKRFLRRVGQKSSFSLVLKNESPLPFFQKFYFSQRRPPPIQYYSKTMWNWLRKQLEATAQSFFPIFYGWRRGVIASSKSFQSSVWVKARFFWFFRHLRWV